MAPRPRPGIRVSVRGQRLREPFAEHPIEIAAHRFVKRRQRRVVETRVTLGWVRAHQASGVASHHGQENPTITAIHHDEREETTADGLQTATIDARALGVGMQVADDTPLIEP